MRYRIVADSSANQQAPYGEVPVSSVPLKIIAGETEFVDDGALDPEKMVTFLESYKGKSGTACPNVSDYLEAFGDAQRVFCFTITSRLSGSYNAACLAKDDYEQAHPDRQVFVLDTLSTGPEMQLLMERAQEDIAQGMEYEDICSDLKKYHQRTALLFSLESLRNLANNGRVSPVVAKLAGVLGIRVVGKASDEGTLETLDKCRGEKKALQCLRALMQSMGYAGGKVRIDHCFNKNAADTLRDLLTSAFPKADVRIGKTAGLCSFYAEKGGLLVGFER